MSTSYMIEPEKKVSVVCDVDVVVAGAGVAGIFAAIAAGRCGCKTLLVDRFAAPGGNIGPGMILGGSLSGGSSRQIHGGFTGIPRELIQRHAALGGGNLPESPNLGDIPPSTGRTNYMEDASIVSHVATQMLKESGVEMLLSTWAADPIMDGDRITGLFVENKSGRGAVKAKVVVDATGEADVAMRAGAPMLFPKSEYHDIDGHAPGGAGVFFVAAGVDWETYRAHAAALEERDETGTGPNLRDLGGQLGGRRVQPPRAGHQDGDYALNAVKLTADSIATREEIFESIQTIKREVPGCENAYVLVVSDYLGSRGGACMEGQYVMTMDDVAKSSRFPDVLLLFGFKNSDWVDLPYRALLPKKLDGLVAVGRSASSIPDTLLRGRTLVMHVGQVGGTAAALAAKNNVLPRELDIKTLQKQLLADGYHLGDDARLAELGLA